MCELVPEAASAIPLAGSDLESDLVLTVLGSARARAQAGRRQDPPRSDPLPQTTNRTRRVQHTQSESALT